MNCYLITIILNLIILPTDTLVRHHYESYKGDCLLIVKTLIRFPRLEKQQM